MPCKLAFFKEIKPKFYFAHLSSTCWYVMLNSEAMITKFFPLLKLVFEKLLKYVDKPLRFSWVLLTGIFNMVCDFEKWCKDVIFYGATIRKDDIFTPFFKIITILRKLRCLHNFWKVAT